MLIDLKPEVQPIKFHQYLIPRNALLGRGLLKRCQSPGNTPLLCVKRPGINAYCPGPDVQAVKEAAPHLHSVLPTPYTPLRLTPSEVEWLTRLDLKYAFSCLQLASSSQPLFALEWENPTAGAKEQFTWTRLQQGFRAPQIF